MKKSTRYEMRDTRYENGSALILVVVLTSLLAIVGVMFVMVARVDRIATSGISENKTLDSAVEMVIAKISQELVLDVPGVGGQPDYYDYPDGENAWLASLEPHKDGTDYEWRQISDVYSKLGPNLELDAGIIPDYQKPSDVGDSNSVTDYPADADGDGVADSKWIELDDITSSKGKTIYAAIRVIDNGGMINVNTAYKFDPNAAGVTAADIDGSSQLQIDLEELARGSDTIDDIADARNPLSRPLLDYQDEVIWKIEDPCSDYLPFDISDELELRNRYFLTTLGRTRLEMAWLSTIGRDEGFWKFKRVPYDGKGGYDEDHWFKAITQDANQPDRRHFLTAYNFDRIIDPAGMKMVWVNNPAATASEIFTAIQSAFNSIPLADWVIPTLAERDAVAAQLAVNIADYVDDDLGVQTQIDAGGTTYYGFEAQPFISEIGIKIGANPLDDTTNHFAVELYNPFNVDIPLDDFKLVLEDNSGVQLPPIALAGDVINANSYYVVVNHSGQFAVVDEKVDNNLVLADGYIAAVPPIYTCSNYNILLTRDVAGQTIYVDRQDTDNSWFTEAGGTMYRERDDDGGHILYQHVADVVAGGSIGTGNSHNAGGLGWKFNLLPFDESQFVTVGDVARILIIGPTEDAGATVGWRLETAANEEDIRVDLENPDFRNLFQYLTVFDPSSDGIDNDSDGYGEAEIDPDELKIPGRININTAPWYVIAQLPWVSNELAQAIVAYRDKLNLSPQGPDYYHSDANDSREQETGIQGLREEAGFASIGELATVVNDSGEDEYSMRYYELDSNDLEDFPDLTPSDKAEDDFEERDVIFARLSNLVTVRSDVFTAYILVRIGADGPQKRVMAILDRSNVYADDGRVQLVALHAVPDPR